jgi:hypothetical protein
MKIKLIFDDWRVAGVSIYETIIGTALSSGQFHSGTTFDGEIELDADDEMELEDALAMGYTPVFRISLP